MQIVKLWLKISALLAILGWLGHGVFDQPRREAPKVVAMPIDAETPPETPAKKPAPAPAPVPSFRLNE